MSQVDPIISQQINGHAIITLTARTPHRRTNHPSLMVGHSLVGVAVKQRERRGHSVARSPHHLRNKVGDPVRMTPETTMRCLLRRAAQPTLWTRIRRLGQPGMVGVAVVDGMQHVG